MQLWPVAAALMVMALPVSATEGLTLFDFEGGFDLARRTAPSGASARLVPRDGGLALRIEPLPGRKWPGVALLPPGGKWDLSEFTRVEMDVWNVGKSKARVMCRVDNPGADGKNHCNTDGLTVRPDEHAALVVVFGMSWGGSGYPIDPANVVRIVVFLDDPKGDEAVLIDNVRAAGGLVKPPAWLGKRPPVPGEWVQTLDENFDGERLNANLWNTHFPWSGLFKGHLEAYSPKNVSVKDGMLRIKVEKRTIHANDDPTQPTRPYASGVVTSYGKFTQRYGYFEARIKLPTFRGGWPAFWMMPDRGPQAGQSWQRRSTHDGGMEIDIMERLCEWGPGLYNCAAHWDGYGRDHKHAQFPLPAYDRTEDDFHAFGLLWEPGRLTWYCDGRKKVTWQNPRVCSVPAYLKFNVQVGGWATNKVDDGALPDYMLVDYVRVWQRRDWDGQAAGSRPAD